MPSSFSASFLTRMGKPQVRGYIYKALQGAGIEEDVEEAHELSEKPGGVALGRLKRVYAGLLICLWFLTAFLLSRLIPPVPGVMKGPRAQRFFPEVPTKAYTFDSDPLFEQPPNAISNAAWDTLMPPGRGRVVIHQPWKYGLPSISLAEPLEVEEYGISVFHQLHCLGVLRYGWFALVADLEPENDQPRHHLSNAAAMHCFDFLRQAIMCSADTTIEPSRYRGRDGAVHTAHGWGVEHTCKDWDAIWRFVMERHAHDNRTGIL